MSFLFINKVKCLLLKKIPNLKFMKLNLKFCKLGLNLTNSNRDLKFIFKLFITLFNNIKGNDINMKFLIIYVVTLENCEIYPYTGSIRK